MREQLLSLRKKMAEKKIDAYFIPTDDFHGSEYVGEYFKCRKYISGFTGSAGTLLVFSDMAGLWTDGRYFIQAAAQLRDSGITLFKMGEPGVPSLEAFLKERLTSGMTFAFDGRCMMENKGESYRKIVEESGATMITDVDLVDEVWTDRPCISKEPAWILELKYAGMSRREKIEIIRKKLMENKADAHVLASLDDICWLLNVRGNDVESTPVVLSYVLMTQNEVIWYVHGECLDDTVKSAMEQDHIIIKEYEEIYDDLKKLDVSSVLYDPGKTNVALVSCIPEGFTQIREANPSELCKAIKNPVEVENERIAHIKDGIAITKFMYYLKTKAIEDGHTEVSLADILVQNRKEQGNYVEESFAPIIAYGDHAAMCHYSAKPETDRKVEARGFLLVDTGGHYLEGSTDITRTFVMGPLTEKEKELYTAVLRGHINLAMARFLPGCSGRNLDVLARTPLWDMGYDYNHGTGHGVGYLLNVHEGPNSIRFRPLPGVKESAMMEGMITSNEPGVYLEDEFGIRLENLVVCRKDEQYQNFLSFETLTMVPFEKEAILTEKMTQREIQWLNEYHKKIYETLSPALDVKVKNWLKEVTEPIK